MDNSCTNCFPSPLRKGLLNQAVAFYDLGNYESAATVLREVHFLQPLFDTGERCEYLRLHARLQCRRGFLDSVAALDRLAQTQPLNFSLSNCPRSHSANCWRKFSTIGTPGLVTAATRTAVRIFIGGCNVMRL